MLPIRDENPSSRKPFVVQALMAANAAVFVLEILISDQTLTRSIHTWGLVPELMVSRPWTLITSMFLHGGVFHVGFNMWFLWIFGDNVEDRLGHWLFLGFYTACGVFGGLTHAIFAPVSKVPCIGASGAISGVIGAYVIFYPRARIVTLLPLFPLILPLRVPAFFFVGYWVVFQFLGGMASLRVETVGGVAYWAHIGGFLVGMVVGFLMGLIPEKEGPRRPPPPAMQGRRPRGRFFR